MSTNWQNASYAQDRPRPWLSRAHGLLKILFGRGVYAQRDLTRVSQAEEMSALRGLLKEEAACITFLSPSNAPERLQVPLLTLRCRDGLNFAEDRQKLGNFGKFTDPPRLMGATAAQKILIFLASFCQKIDLGLLSY